MSNHYNRKIGHSFLTAKPPDYTLAKVVFPGGSVCDLALGFPPPLKMMVDKDVKTETEDDSAVCAGQCGKNGKLS